MPTGTEQWICGKQTAMRRFNRCLILGGDKEIAKQSGTEGIQNEVLCGTQPQCCKKFQSRSAILNSRKCNVEPCQPRFSREIENGTKGIQVEIFYWSIIAPVIGGTHNIALQSYVSFCCATKRSSHTYAPAPSLLSLPSTLPSRASRSSQSTRLSSLCYTAGSLQLFS